MDKPNYEQYVKYEFLNAIELACLIVDCCPKNFHKATTINRDYLEFDSSCLTDFDQIIDLVGGYESCSTKVDEVKYLLEVIQRESDASLRDENWLLRETDSVFQRKYKTGNAFTWARKKGYRLDKVIRDAFSLKPIVCGEKGNGIESDYLRFLDKSNPCYSPDNLAVVKLWCFAESKHGESQVTPKKLLEDNFDEITKGVLRKGIDKPFSQDAKKRLIATANYRVRTSSISLKEKKKNMQEISEYRKKTTSVD